MTLKTENLFGDTLNEYYDNQSDEEDRISFVARTTARSITNNAVPVNDDQLFLNVRARTEYNIYLSLKVYISTAPDLKITFTVPTGTTGSLSINSPAGITGIGITPNPYGMEEEQIVYTSTAAYYNMIIEGSFQTTNPGIIYLKWAQNTSSASQVIMAIGSYMRITKI